ncbi:hypothetical protein GGD63_001057 [Bradyrhizobium sp. cir1]|uniref:hypothetical protein n=1 Tax=Bradyrhizobium sp. cir1 TaxID=1445730 RepID=UPI001605DC95|nr:hypothetical protein [Bradyrhizobium sp. cir1]MBB4368278.1 hypothetical protein [Bradyrhizobium sp. cir1]
MESLDYEFIRWSIDARKSIQAAILNLTQCADGPMRGGKNAERFTELTGVAFSLWRAAFLASMGTTPLVDDRMPDSTDKKSQAKVDHAADLLRTILASNTVSFADDRRTQSWMAEFYIDNASMRLMRYIEKHGPEFIKAPVERFINYAREHQVPTGLVASAHAWTIIFACFNEVLDALVSDMKRKNLVTVNVLDNSNYKFRPRPATLEDLFLEAHVETGEKP